MNNDQPVHYWFGLSYSNYLVLPRLTMESMPVKWQRKMVRLLEEMDDTLIIDPKYTGDYLVKLRDEKGKFITDPYANYRRGNKLELKPKAPKGYLNGDAYVRNYKEGG